MNTAFRLPIGLLLLNVCLLFSSPMRGEVLTEVLSSRDYGTIRAVRFTPGGTLLAVAGSDRKVHLLKADDGTEVRALRVPAGAISSMTFNETGQALITGGHSLITFWKTTTGEQAEQLKAGIGRVLALAVSPEGDTLAAAGSGGSVHLLSLPGFETLHKLSFRAPTVALEFSRDGRFLAAVGGGRVTVWDTRDGTAVPLPSLAPGIQAGIFIGQRKLAVGTRGRQLALIDLSGPTPGQTYRDHLGGILSLAISGDGRWMAGSDDARSLIIREAATGEAQYGIKDLSGKPTALALNKSGDRLAAGMSGSGATFRLWSVDTAAIEAGEASMWGGAFDADYLSRLEMEIVQEQNLARTDPKAYADFARRRLATFSGKVFKTTDGRAITSKEGRAAVQEAIEFLLKQKPLKFLTPVKGLSLAANDHVEDTGPKGLVGHDGADGSAPADRAARHGQWQKFVGENISYGAFKARDVVLQLIIDDGVANRGHRANIYRSDFRVVGVGIGRHRQYGTMCVIQYAGGYKDK